MTRIRNIELCLESCDQIITGCKQINGCIIVKMTSNVVNTSIFDVLEAQCDNLKYGIYVCIQLSKKVFCGVCIFKALDKQFRVVGGTGGDWWVTYFKVYRNIFS